jgi:hypothetical protein
VAWDTREYALRCEGCGRIGKEVVRENDWMQTETSYEGFERGWVEGLHPGMKDAQGDFEYPRCTNCGDEGKVLRFEAQNK